jgi:flagellar motor switch/type III secretory pathway protein FliN
MATAGQAMSSKDAEKPRDVEGVGQEAVRIDETRWRLVLGLLCQISVDVPLPNFKVADFLKLKAGSVIPSAWRVTRDVPVRVNGTLIAWGEFEGASGHLGVRITEIA